MHNQKSNSTTPSNTHNNAFSNKEFTETGNNYDEFDDDINEESVATKFIPFTMNQAASNQLKDEFKQNNQLNEKSGILKIPLQGTTKSNDSTQNKSPCNLDPLLTFLFYC